ncbi:hypothetical protein [Lacipirellula limnantheis]|uniref:hypothetical protein n=1 Tax=Lacipirellula limnantheis TaxID=2528024 RepID=UPI0011AB0DD9|nr:hypothetical protein [Lacipirellula limnantheis]
MKTPTAKPPIAKVGVIATILAELRKATKDKPVTKAQLGERLAKAFPDKEPTGLARTVSCQVPGRISREQEVTVKSDGEGGFWIA